MNIELIELSGLVTALKGLRLPFKKDCLSDIDFEFFDNLKHFHEIHYKSFVVLDNKDYSLLKILRRKGNSDAKVLRFIDVSLEINAPRFFWSEFDTYKIGTVTISESTMHTIINDELTLENFIIEDEDDKIEVINFINSVTEYKQKNWASRILLKRKIKKHLPECFLQRRIVKLNYQTLRTIYFDRRKHELIEWQAFCDYIVDLPLSELIILEN